MSSSHDKTSTPADGSRDCRAPHHDGAATRPDVREHLDALLDGDLSIEATRRLVDKCGRRRESRLLLRQHRAWIDELKRSGSRQVDFVIPLMKRLGIDNAIFDGGATAKQSWPRLRRRRTMAAALVALALLPLVIWVYVIGEQSGVRRGFALPSPAAAIVESIQADVEPGRRMIRTIAVTVQSLAEMAEAGSSEGPAHFDDLRPADFFDPSLSPVWIDQLIAPIGPDSHDRRRQQTTDVDWALGPMDFA